MDMSRKDSSLSYKSKLYNKGIRFKFELRCNKSNVCNTPTQFIIKIEKISLKRNPYKIITSYNKWKKKNKK